MDSQVEVKRTSAKKPKANSPLCVMYVEVNDANMKNVSCYSLNTGEPLFDIGIIFAANINYNVSERRAILFFNPNVTRVLNDVDQYVRPIQQRGTKVLLSILGNHEGAGFCNFPDAAAARDFAEQLKAAVDNYGLDGIDFDDEYADYGNNGTGQPNDFSFLYLLRELRSIMPDKIISFYYYGPAASRLSYDGMVAGDYVDYSWNAIYGSYNPPNVPGLDKSQLSAAAVNVNSTSTSTARNLATRTIQDGYGVYLMYALPNSDQRVYMSEISQVLYDKQTTVAQGCLGKSTPCDPDQTKCKCRKLDF